MKVFDSSNRVNKRSKKIFGLQLYGVFVFCFLLFSCHKKEDYLFKLVDVSQSGLDFSNDITPTKDLNIFNYMYFYNGGGLGAGDLNNDGLVDLIFTANQKQSKIYLNQGGLKFIDVTTQSNFIGELGWSTGV